MNKRASSIHRALGEFLSDFVQGDPRYSRTIAAANALRAAIDDEFDTRGANYHTTPRITASLRTLQNRVQYQQRKMREIERRCQELEADKLHGRIQDVWFVRVGLADPAIATRTLQDMCEMFAVGQAISAPYIGQVRDAMAQVVKSFNRASAAALCASLPNAEVVIRGICFECGSINGMWH